jgi:hypothetical protein
MKKISILTPTRERAKQAEAYAQTVFETAASPERVELLFYVDSDDSQKALYEQFDLLNTTLIVGAPISVSKSWNVLAAMCEGDILFMGNDDLYHVTKGWDVALEKTSNEYVDDIYCIFFDDGINKGKHCAFPAVSRTWYNTLGYFAPGIFEFFYNDTWIFDIAKRIRRVRYVPEVLVEHRHFTVTKIADATTTRNRKRVSGSSQTKNTRDKNLFESTESLRVVAADKLKEVMGYV